MRSPAVERIDPADPDHTIIRQAAELLRAGGLVAFPTETVYGLGANALDPEAVAKVYAAKGRPANNPLIVHVAEPGQADAVADLSELARQLAAAFWPGPLTLVLPRRPVVPDAVTAGGSTVAIRCPAHPVARALIAATGAPIAAPSANRSGHLSPTRAEHVLASLGGAVDLVLDGGPCPGGIESTVVDVSRQTVRVLRPGLISAPTLEAVAGRVETCARPADEATVPSPGMSPRHYAPNTALELAETPEEAGFLKNLYETAGLRVATWQAAGDPAATAARLYADLHDLDGSGFDRIIAVLPPACPVWAAIRDRLTRAAAEL